MLSSQLHMQKIGLVTNKQLGKKMRLRREANIMIELLQGKERQNFKKRDNQGQLTSAIHNLNS
jgi:hypothetical protein